MTPKTRIAAVDDHHLFISGLERALRLAPDIEFIARGSCGNDALKIAAETPPDIMLLDITMPGGGIETARLLAQHHPAIKVIILTASSDEDKLQDALAAGARGFLLKGIQLPELLDAIHTVASGEDYLSPEVAARLLLQSSKLERRKKYIQESFSALSEREQEMLLLLTQGLVNSEIAEEMDLSIETVKTYVSRIFSKINCSNRVQAVRLAIGGNPLAH
jgi:two-component system, NarL family, nitrate/nitrite response regulator NarL